MTNKESNFVSAVVYLHNEQQRVEAFLARLGEFLSGRFSRYEIICVDDGCTDGTVDLVRGFCAGQAAPVTVIHMSLRQGPELCMNAGLDMAIGDFVYEFDSASLAWPEHLLGEAYDMALGQNRDIVAVAPAGSARLTSRLFYGVFNRCAPAGVHPLRSEAFRLLSRRAINRVHAVSSHLPYRKAAYAFSGLGYGVLEYPGKAADSLQGRRFGQAVEHLEAVHLGHDHIQQDGAVALRICEDSREALAAVFRRLRLVVGLKQIFQDNTVDLVVVHDQKRVLSGKREWIG